MRGGVASVLGRLRTSSVAAEGWKRARRRTAPRANLSLLSEQKQKEGTQRQQQQQQQQQPQRQQQQHKPRVANSKGRQLALMQQLKDVQAQSSEVPRAHRKGLKRKRESGGEEDERAEQLARQCCSRVAALLSDAKAQGIPLNKYHYGSALATITRCGRWRGGLQLLHEMKSVRQPVHSTCLDNVLVACKHAQQLEYVVDLSLELFRTGKADVVTLEHALSACAMAGDPDTAMQLLATMSSLKQHMAAKRGVGVGVGSTLGYLGQPRRVEDTQEAEDNARRIPSPYPAGETMAGAGGPGGIDKCRPIRPSDRCFGSLVNAFRAANRPAEATRTVPPLVDKAGLQQSVEVCVPLILACGEANEAQAQAFDAAAAAAAAGAGGAAGGSGGGAGVSIDEWDRAASGQPDEEHVIVGGKGEGEGEGGIGWMQVQGGSVTGWAEEVLGLVAGMKKSGQTPPDEFLYSAAISTLGKLGDFQSAMRLFREIEMELPLVQEGERGEGGGRGGGQKVGRFRHGACYTAAIQACIRTRAPPKEALTIARSLQRRGGAEGAALDGRAVGSVLAALGQSGLYDEALQLLEEAMKAENSEDRPDASTFVWVAHATTRGVEALEQQPHLFVDGAAAAAAGGGGVGAAAAAAGVGAGRREAKTQKGGQQGDSNGGLLSEEWAEEVGEGMSMSLPSNLRSDWRSQRLASKERREAACRALLSMKDAMLAAGAALDAFNLTVLIDQCGKANLHTEALALLTEMRDSGVRPDVVAYGALLSSCAKASDLDGTMRVLGEMREDGIQPNEECYSAAIAACAVTGQADTALHLLNRRHVEGLEANPVCYGAAMSACLKGGMQEETLGLFQDMKNLGLAISQPSFTTAIKAALDLGDEDKVVEFVQEMRNKFSPHPSPSRGVDHVGGGVGGLAGPSGLGGGGGGDDDDGGGVGNGFVGLDKASYNACIHALQEVGEEEAADALFSEAYTRGLFLYWRREEVRGEGGGKVYRMSEEARGRDGWLVDFHGGFTVASTKAALRHMMTQLQQQQQQQQQQQVAIRQQQGEEEGEEAEGDGDDLLTIVTGRGELNGVVWRYTQEKLGLQPRHVEGNPGRLQVRRVSGRG